MANQLPGADVLLYWCNSVGVPSCLLVSSLADLKDGTVFADLLAYLDGQPVSSHTQYGIRSVLSKSSKLQSFFDSLRARFDHGKFSPIPTAKLAEETLRGNEYVILYTLQCIRFLMNDGPSPAPLQDLAPASSASAPSPALSFRSASSSSALSSSSSSNSVLDMNRNPFVSNRPSSALSSSSSSSSILIAPSPSTGSSSVNSLLYGSSSAPSSVRGRQPSGATPRGRSPSPSGPALRNNNNSAVHSKRSASPSTLLRDPSPSSSLRSSVAAPSPSRSTQRGGASSSRPASASALRAPSPTPPVTRLLSSPAAKSAAAPLPATRAHTSASSSHVAPVTAAAYAMSQQQQQQASTPSVSVSLSDKRVPASSSSSSSSLSSSRQPSPAASRPQSASNRPRSASSASASHSSVPAPVRQPSPTPPLRSLLLMDLPTFASSSSSSSVLSHHPAMNLSSSSSSLYSSRIGVAPSPRTSVPFPAAVSSAAHSLSASSDFTPSSYSSASQQRPMSAQPFSSSTFSSRSKQTATTPRRSSSSNGDTISQQHQQQQLSSTAPRTPPSSAASSVAYYVLAHTGMTPQALHSAVGRKLRRSAEMMTSPLTPEQDRVATWLHNIGIEIPSKNYPSQAPVPENTFSNSSFSPSPRRSSSRTPHQQPTAFEVVEAFRSGVLLCELVMLLENADLHGVVKQPRSSAAMVANLNRALTVLRDRPKISPRWLWSGQDIMRGSPEAVWGLLSDLQRVYSTRETWKSKATVPSTASQRRYQTPPIARPIAF